MDYRQRAIEHAKRTGLDPRLFKALITAESNWDPKAVSPVGAKGFGQVMDDTARQPGFGVTPLADPFNPEDNLRFSSDYFSKMMQRYNGDHRRALAAYNWGAGNADKWDGNLANRPEETRNYITKIESNLAEGPGALSAGGSAPGDGDGIGPDQPMLATQGRIPPNPNAITQFPVAGPEPVSVTSLATGQKPFPEVIADLERQALRDGQVPIEQIGISPEEAYRQDSFPVLASSGLTEDQIAQDALDSSKGPSSVTDPQYEPRGSFKDFFGLGNAEGGGAISRWLGWDTLSGDQRDQRWLAIGAGLLGGKDWAEGGSLAAQGLMQVNQQEQDEAYRYAALAARAQGGGAGWQKVGSAVDNRTGDIIGGVMFDPGAGYFRIGPDGQREPLYDITPLNNSDASGSRYVSPAQAAGLRESVQEAGGALRAIDRLEEQLSTYDTGVEGFVRDMSVKAKTFLGSTNLTEREIQAALAQGEVQGLIGKVREDVVGPGVMTEQDALRVLAFIGGGLGGLGGGNPTVIMERLNLMRESILRGYNQNFDQYDQFTKLPGSPYLPLERYTPRTRGDQTGGAAGAGLDPEIDEILKQQGL